ncbi:hypothetical protein SAMN02745203_00232 [Porphyromonas crevioricanis]|nr:hypothetical protein SAMN02745203_00232 [Porphyromonas crevioricanis]
MCRALVSRPAPEINLRLFSEEGCIGDCCPMQQSLSICCGILRTTFVTGDCCIMRLLRNTAFAALLSTFGLDYT